MAEETIFDPTLFDPNHRPLAQPPQPHVYDNDCLNEAFPYLQSGLSGENNPHRVPFPYQLGETEDGLFPFNNVYQYPPTALNPAIDAACSTSNADCQTLPSNALALAYVPKERINANNQPRKKTAAIKQNPSPEKPGNLAPTTRTPSKRKATNTTNNQTKKQKETKIKDRRETSLEQNRAAASKFRNRKKQWTNHLEQKKSELEAVHTDLQGVYMDLLQESLQLKNVLISHASCQDSNIGIWIRNEASKYVHNLHSPHSDRVNSLRHAPSLDEPGSASPHSPTTSHITYTQESPDHKSQDSNSDEFSDEEDAFEGGLHWRQLAVNG